MNKKAKSLLAVMLVVVLAAAMFICWKLFLPEAQAGDKTLAVTVTHADGSVRDFTLETDAEYLWDAMYERGLIDGTDGEYGKWVTTVDGRTADENAGQYWLFTRDGDWVETSCDTTPIADGESYEFFIYFG